MIINLLFNYFAPVGQGMHYNNKRHSQNKYAFSGRSTNSKKRKFVEFEEEYVNLRLRSKFRHVLLVNIPD